MGLGLMKILIDTNIISHREASINIIEDIDTLFYWIENLHYTKCVHPISLECFNKHPDSKIKKTIEKQLGKYYLLIPIPFGEQLKNISKEFDKCENDINDTILLNELFIGRVDLFVTEEKRIKQKATLLNLHSKVLSIDAFLEKVVAENPGFVDYKALVIKKEYFENIDIKSSFFKSLKQDYLEFDKWFEKKRGEIAYICKSDQNLLAFLYLKIEIETEDYSDISPRFDRKKRLKIGTFKVALNGFGLGERFLKIIFESAIIHNVDEIYLSLYKKNIEQLRLINLLQEFGFILHGFKASINGNEHIYVRKLNRIVSRISSKSTYPFISTLGKFYIIPVCSEYHAELFSDHILSCESPIDFEENDPFRNVISKVYISSLPLKGNPKSGDILIFCSIKRNKSGLITTIGIVEKIINRIKLEEEFIPLYHKRFILTESQFSDHYKYKANSSQVLINFLQYSLPKKVTIKRLIQIGLINKKESTLKNFMRISKEDFKILLKECQVDESLIIN